jgi:hypothetical protein
MGDVLGELNVSDNEDVEFQQGKLSFQMGASEKTSVSKMGGLDNLKLNYNSGNVDVSAGYQNYFTDGENRFNATANPIMAMASNTVFSDFKYKSGDYLTFGVRAFSGAITDENLLASDPTVSGNYEHATLGLIQGGQSDVRIGNKQFGITTAVGFANETDTLLGAQTSGLLALGNGDTTYIDSKFDLNINDNVNFALRSVFAQTTANPTGELITELSNIKTNSFSASADIGNFSLTAAMPLAVVSGNFNYAAADYQITEDADGKFGLAANLGIENVSLVPTARELRFTGAYRQKLGEFTDGALGFIYRVNPNNTDEYGNESIFMFKISHRIGI